MKIKIYGAGSIGNHLSNASRSMGWSVDICDIDHNALTRTKNEIYPGRYGKWDDSIGLYNVKEAPRGAYDMIFIGTPPDSHIKIALDAIEESPKAILIEKPVCTPMLEDAQKLVDLAKSKNIKLFVGYDHIVSSAINKVEELLYNKSIGEIETLDVEFREHWQGIFNAHPWLSGPSDTYLGFWERGGGASGEHSHALNMWQHLALNMGFGRVVEVTASGKYIQDSSGANYDKICFFNLKTESGMVGRVVQDVITLPTRKCGKVQGKNGSIEWTFSAKPGLDKVELINTKDERQEFNYSKTRPDDFILEMKHIKNVLDGKISESAISLQRGLDSMLVVSAAHLSIKNNRSVLIDYSKGYHTNALTLL